MEVDWSSEKKSNLERFSSPVDPVKVIVAIWKLNESVDIPTVENVVFWGDTDVQKVFLQQFWRGLRWDGVVHYFDYVWGIKNFAWIGAIYEDYLKFSSWKWGEKETLEWWKESRFSIQGWSTISEEHWIDINSILFDFVELQKSTEKKQLTREEIEEYLFNYEWRSKEDSFMYLINLKLSDISKISLHGVSYIDIMKICEWNNMLDFNERSIAWFKDFILTLFWYSEAQWLTKSKIKKFFFNFEWRDKERSYIELMKLSQGTLNFIRRNYYDKYFYKKMSIIAWWENEKGLDIYKKEWFQDFIRYLFWK